MPACSNRLNAAADGWTASVPLAFALAFALDLGRPAIAVLQNNSPPPTIFSPVTGLV